ncbi:hypothetical protein [uncultured Acinetobacter sp.]|uniref:hypothetical protein n=1 Tax=uncultured Acinetobacter sp. TaxID=165433 RepID=UPI00374942E9
MVFTVDEIKELEVLGEIPEKINQIYTILDTNKFGPISKNNNEDIKIDKEVIFIEIRKFIIRFGNILKNDLILKDFFELPVDLLRGKLFGIKLLNSMDLIFSDFIYVLYDFIEFYILENDSLRNINSNLNFKSAIDLHAKIEGVLPARRPAFNSGFFNMSSSNANNYFLGKIKELENKLEISDSKIQGAVSSYLCDNEKYYRQKVDESLNKISILFNTYKVQYENNEKKEVEALSLSVAESRKELDNLFDDIDHYKSIISEKTQDEISKFYAKKSIWERNTYLGMTLLSLVIILIAVGLAWFGLSNYYTNYVDPTGFIKSSKNLTVDQFKLTQTYAFNYLILRLVISALLFLTIIYTSRIAYRAYIHWRHSENMHLKLSSLRPFINQLQKDERNQIHKDLIPDYFGKDAGMVDGVSEKFKDLPANVSALAIKAIEQIGGNKEKKEEESKSNQNGDPNK